jgi:hypothetical protein
VPAAASARWRWTTLVASDANTGAPGWTYQALSESARILAASSPRSPATLVRRLAPASLVALRTANGNDLWNEALSRASRTSSFEIRDIPHARDPYQGDVFAVSHSGVFAATDLRNRSGPMDLPVGITSPAGRRRGLWCPRRAGGLRGSARAARSTGRATSTPCGGQDKERRLLAQARASAKNLKPIWSSPYGQQPPDHRGTTGELVALNAKTGNPGRELETGPGPPGSDRCGRHHLAKHRHAQLIAPLSGALQSSMALKLRSSAGRTSASPRCSTGWRAASSPSSMTSRGSPATGASAPAGWATSTWS